MEMQGWGFSGRAGILKNIRAELTCAGWYQFCVHAHLLVFVLLCELTMSGLVGSRDTLTSITTAVRMKHSLLVFYFLFVLNHILTARLFVPFVHP